MSPDTRKFNPVQTRKKRDEVMLEGLARDGGFEAMKTLYREHGWTTITTDDGRTFDLKEMFGEK